MYKPLDKNKKICYNNNKGNSTTQFSFAIIILQNNIFFILFAKAVITISIESVRSMLECRYDLSDVYISDDENDILKNFGKYNFYIYYSYDNSYKLVNENIYKVSNDEDLISVLEYYFNNKQLFKK